MTRASVLWCLGLAVALAGCGSDRRASTYRPPNDDCTRGSLLPCTCADGRDGLATCDGTRYGACECEGGDAGTSAPDASADRDAAAPRPDAAGFDAGPPPPRDAGFVDVGFPDAGFYDSGVRPDAGFPDSGVRPDAGFYDSGVRPDAGFPDSGTPPGPCNSDPDCGAPLMVCEAGQCIPGCLSGDPSGLVCATPEDCNFLTGRCDGLGICITDTDCNPPFSVCELFFCAPGCGQPGAPACAAGTTCNPATGRCQ